MAAIFNGWLLLMIYVLLFKEDKPEVWDIIADPGFDYTDREWKEKFLRDNGWETSWGEDNWVRSDAKNKEANTGTTLEAAYNYVRRYGNGNTLMVIPPKMEANGKVD